MILVTGASGQVGKHLLMALSSIWSQTATQLKSSWTCFGITTSIVSAEMLLR